MVIIGITGPSGSGKSEICAKLNAAGIPTLNADKIYHRLLTPPSELLDLLAEHFGQEIIRDVGTLDRSALAAKVFAPGAESELETLNRITHGRVLAKMSSLISQYSKMGCSALTADVPLLFESGFDKECDLTVAVVADKAIRTERIMKRDGMEYEAAVARTSAQKPEGFYTSRADIVIKNNSGEDELEKEVSALLEKIGEIIKCQGRKK